MNPKLPLLLFFSMSLCFTSLHAEEKSPDWNNDTLTGDWNGARASLYKAGVDIGLTHRSGVLSNVSGGLERGTAWLGHSEIRADFDLEKLLGWDSTHVFLLYHSQLGSKFNTRYIGSAAGVDSDEVATNTAQFYMAYLQKNFFEEKLSVLFGLYAIDGAFNLNDSADIFTLPATGIAAEIATTAENGAPAFPIGDLMLHVKAYSPSKDFYMQAALADAVPGDPNNPRGTHIKLGNNEGSLAIAELAYSPQAADDEAENFNKTAIGYWRYSNQFDALDGLGTRHKSQGFYALAEQTLFHENGSKTQGLAGFARFGVASEKVNAIDWTGAVGLRYRGLIAGRDDDVAGIAATLSHASTGFRSTGDFDSHETIYEITYRAQVKPWLTVQPLAQAIINPGFDPNVKNAYVIGARVAIEF
jgi:porin